MNIVAYKSFCFREKIFGASSLFEIKNPYGATRVPRTRANRYRLEELETLVLAGLGLKGCGAPDLAGSNSGFGDSPSLSVLWALPACFVLRQTYLVMSGDNSNKKIKKSKKALIRTIRAIFTLDESTATLTRVILIISIKFEEISDIKIRKTTTNSGISQP